MEIGIGVLPTNELKFWWHMTNDTICPLCKDKVKDVMHVLRDCKWVQPIWWEFNMNVGSVFFNCDIPSWLTMNVL